MPIKRLAGTVKIAGTSYQILREKEKLVYARKSVPKFDLSTQLPGAATGQSNMLEYIWGSSQGFGDADQTKGRDLYHYGMNFYMEHEGEAVYLPSALYSLRTDNPVYDFFRPPVGIFELVPYGDQPDSLDTYWIQDAQVCKISGAAAPNFRYARVKTFEKYSIPTDVAVFNNKAYIAMGASADRLSILSAADNGTGKPRFRTSVAHNFAVGSFVRIANSLQTGYNGIWVVSTVTDPTHFDAGFADYVALSPDVPVTAVVWQHTARYLRTFDGTTFSRDDNDTHYFVGTANNGAGKSRFHCVGHGYTTGDYVFLFSCAGNTNAPNLNSLDTSGASTLYQITAVSDVDHFDIAALAYTSNAVGYLNRQDSDVQAEHLCIVGDLMVRAYKDADGWKTSRVDIVSSNPLLDANWTAGIGTVSVGDADSPITDLVAVGDGELVLKAEGAFVYRRNKGAYLNDIPELEEHRHPRNGRGSFEWKGWVYIPTIVGVFRWRNGQVQNVTPGHGGQQSFATPIGPIGWFTGDTERLYAITEPFKVNQPKTVTGTPPTRIYIDPNNTGAADASSGWGLDPSTDLKGFGATGYLYLGSTVPWHRMFVEIDPVANALAWSTGLYIDVAQYWNGSSWVSRLPVIDYTHVRNTTNKNPASLGQTGDLVFNDVPPSDWAKGGTVGGVQGTVDSSYYWCRFSFSAAITSSTIIRRIIAGVHDANSVFSTFSTVDLQTEHAGAQFVLSMTEMQGKGVVWHTMWGWQQPETTSGDGITDFTVGGAQPTGALGIVQPNTMRAGPTGTRFLFVGLHHRDYLCPLGHAADPTEDGPGMGLIVAAGTNGITSNRRNVLVFPDTDLGLSTATKVLSEINMELENIAASDITLYYRVDSGPWISAGNVSGFPHKLTAGSEPSGNKFGLAVVVAPSVPGNFVRLPRIQVLPSVRGFTRPELAETISMSIVLEAEQLLPGQSDRRAAKTSFATLKTLQTSAVSVPYTDDDQTTDYVHVMQVTKRFIHNAEEEPKVICDLILSVVP